MATERIPFFDPSRAPEQQRLDTADSVRQVTERGAFILGEEVERFEQQFASFCEAECPGRLRQGQIP